jgi:hypothetical protein
MPPFFFTLSQLGDQADQAFGPDPHLQRVLLDVDPFDQELDDARLLGAEQLAPDRGEAGEQAGDLAFGDLVLALALCRRFLLHRLNRGRLIVPGPGDDPVCRHS